MNQPHALRPIARLLMAGALAASAAAGLSGCFPLVVGGATYSALVLTDRRTVGAQTEDTGIELKARNQIGDRVKESGGIGIVSFNRRVLLYGQVRDEQARKTAGEVAARVDNVVKVHNELQVGGRLSIGSMASDTTITTKVKASLVDTKDLQANAFKVITEGGVVYLMGIVTRAEGDRAASVASRTSGVMRVVTVYEYVTEEELAKAQARPAPVESAK